MEGVLRRGYLARSTGRLGIAGSKTNLERTYKMNSSELLARVKNLLPQLEEKSAKGFRTEEVMHLLYQLEGTVGALLAVACAEYSKEGGR